MVAVMSAAMDRIRQVRASISKASEGASINPEEVRNFVGASLFRWIKIVFYEFILKFSSLFMRESEFIIVFLQSATRTPRHFFAMRITLCVCVWPAFRPQGLAFLSFSSLQFSFMDMIRGYPTPPTPVHSHVTPSTQSCRCDHSLSLQCPLSSTCTAIFPRVPCGAFPPQNLPHPSFSCAFKVRARGWAGEGEILERTTRLCDMRVSSVGLALLVAFPTRWNCITQSLSHYIPSTLIPQAEKETSSLMQKVQDAVKEVGLSLGL